MRTIVHKTISDVSVLKKQFLQWSQGFREVVILDSNSEFNASNSCADYDYIVSVDAFTAVKTDAYNGFQDLHQYQSQIRDWIFGYLSYDLKNDVEDLKSENFDGLSFPDLFFFQPKKLFLIKGNELQIHYLALCDDEIESDFEDIINLQIDQILHKTEAIQIKQRISKESYLQKTTALLQHIQQGGLYEANFCMEFYAENATILPHLVYQDLINITQTPFSCFFKNSSDYLLCASPERYLKKQNQKIISQPIKGTAKRFENEIEDAIEKLQLELNPKERSENIMIVDLVRNDLSRTAVKGSVKVEELCKSYTFKQVHQLISTVVSEVDFALPPVAVLQTTFPMGSMTGAPKIAALKIIEDLEETKRGLYSGAIGYFTPNGDFDFNVVIRSILYNIENQYLSFSVGSAITAEAQPEDEYDECILKASAMFQVLGVEVKS